MKKINQNTLHYFGVNILKRHLINERSISLFINNKQKDGHGVPVVPLFLLR